MTKKKTILVIVAVVLITAFSYIVYRQFFAVVVTDPEDAERLKESQPLLDIEISIDAPASLFAVPRVKRSQWQESEEIVLLLKNNTADNLVYGRDNTFEIELDGEWYYMYCTGAPSFGIELPPRAITVVRHWMSKDVEWVPGHYRVVKEIIKDAPNQRRQTWIVAAEFYIE